MPVRGGRKLKRYRGQETRVLLPEAAKNTFARGFRSD